LDFYNKLSVFNPNAIAETRYKTGRHWAAPTGHVRYPKQDELLLLHYKFLGLNYLLGRYALLSGGLGPADRALSPFQYDSPQFKLEAEFEELRRIAVDVTSVEAARFTRNKWWRKGWWRQTARRIVEHLPYDSQVAVANLAAVLSLKKSGAVRI